MFRSVPIIIAMLGEVGVSGARAKTYAPVLQELGKKHHIDPATLIVLVAGESGWREGTVNHLGCVGLGQHCVSALYGFCRKGTEYDKVRCDAKISQLKNGVYNLRATAAAISKNRAFCNDKTNKRSKKSRSQWRHWLPSYGGYNSPSKGIWCGQKRVKTKRGWRWRNVPVPKRIAKYMKERTRLIRAVTHKRRKKS
jgi:hypothetical protein